MFHSPEKSLKRKVMILRHGEQKWDPSMLTMPEIDPGLTAKGEAQTEKVATFLDEKFNRKSLYIFSSDALCAQETGMKIQEKNKNAIFTVIKTVQDVYLDSDNFEIKIIESGLREIYLGNYAREAHKFTDENGHIIASKIPKAGTLDDSETNEQVSKRMLEAIESITSDPTIPENAEILIISHSHAMRCLFHNLTGKPFNSFTDISHGSIFELLPNQDFSLALNPDQRIASCTINKIETDRQLDLFYTYKGQALSIPIKDESFEIENDSLINRTIRKNPCCTIL